MFSLELRPLTWSDPIQWLRLGWADFQRCPRIGLFYGLCFFVMGHALLAVDPGALAGTDAFAERMETLVTAMLGDDGVRLPGSRRDALRAAAERDGIEVPEALLAHV